MEEFLTGKRISILGDSVSTYSGVSDSSAYNRTLCSNPCYYPKHYMELKDTYWMRLIDRFGLTLCVNNSWSGSFMTRHVPYNGTDPSAVLSPAVERVKYLGDIDGNIPDIIVIFSGLNDLGSYISSKEFVAAYRETLGTVKKLYVNAQTFCVGMPDRCEEMKGETERYNDGIMSVVTEAGENFHYVDLFDKGLRGKDYRDNTIDGVHPSSSGMKAIAEVISEEFAKLK